MLGPLLFLLHINDLPNISKHLKFFLFADDTNIYYVANDLKNLEKKMNKELQKLYEWLCINRVTLNISKTNCIIFHAINKPKVPVTILINKIAIEETKYVKYLGILIDPQFVNMEFKRQLSKKVSRSIGILFKLRHFVTTNNLLNIYHAIIYPFLLCGITIWGSTCKTILNPLYILQKKFVRLVTFNDTFPSEYRSLSHTPPLFQKLNILNIFDIFKVQVGKLVCESLNCIGPTKKIIKFTRASEVHMHNTRYSSDGNHYNQYARTTRYGLRSLQIEGGKLWSTPHHYQKL